MAVTLAKVNGEIILQSNSVDLKIGRDRKLYKRYPEGSNRGNFIYIGKKIEYGLNRLQKETFLLKLRQKLIPRIQEGREKKAEGEEREDDQDAGVVVNYNTPEDDEGGDDTEDADDDDDGGAKVNEEDLEKEDEDDEEKSNK